MKATELELTIGRTESRLRSVVEMIHFNSYVTSVITVSHQPGSVVLNVRL